jgi:hypothetical protein
LALEKGGGVRFTPIVVALMFSSCAFFAPVASVHLSMVPESYRPLTTDTTKTLFIIDTDMHLDFNLNGSNIIKSDPGEREYVADGIEPGWYYLDVVGSNTWVRNVPVYLNGGDEIQVDAGPDHLDIGGRIFFNSYQEKSTIYSFYPMLLLRCFGCSTEPSLRFDGSPMVITQSWTTVMPGWHTIEIYSPLDHVQLYYRALFDNYTITQFDFYPVSTF